MKRRPLTFSGLQARLLLLVFLAVIPSLGLILYTAWDERRAAAPQMQAHLLHLARIVSTDHERLVEGARQLLSGLAQLRELRDRDARGCSAIFANLLRQYPVYANLGAIESDGIAFCSGVPILSAIYAGDRPYFRRAIETRDFAVGNYQIGRATGKATINFAYPVLDSRGRVRTVVFAAMDLAWLNRLSARARWPEGSTVTVLDSTGIVLARHPDPETWVGRFVHDAPFVKAVLTQGGEGTIEARGLEGTPHLFAFAPLGGLPPGSAVYVVLGISKDAAFAEINRALRRNLVGMAVVTILGLAAAWLIGGWFILNRVRALVNATRRLAAGDLGARTALSYDGELGELAHAFDEMAETLQLREAQASQTGEELRRQREALFQSEKLVAMGQLLAGVAHELNNPLSVVLGRTALLREAARDGPLRVQIEKISQAAERCARIVRNFLALARQHPTERQRVGLNQVVQEAVELLAYPLRVDGVEVTLDLDRNLPILWADPHQLHQVVVNLVSNAHQAMRGAPPPRRLTIRTRSGSARDRVSLEVADTGPGLPPEVQSRIFEPFFTTKPPGEGTGLGLPLCLGIVEAHGGSIRVESQPGQGAVFSIELPVEAPAVVEPERGTVGSLPPVQWKTILIVDDEPDVAGTLADLLRLEGHQVETAPNGVIALEKLRERSYDLVMSDIRMPELDGPGLYRELERRDARLLQRLIFLTGDALSRETAEFLGKTGVTTLSKPFVLPEVRAMVQRMLRNRPGGGGEK